MSPETDATDDQCLSLLIKLEPLIYLKNTLVFVCLLKKTAQCSVLETVVRVQYLLKKNCKSYKYDHEIYKVSNRVCKNSQF